jgi:hypothetical protein
VARQNRGVKDRQEPTQTGPAVRETVAAARSCWKDPPSRRRSETSVGSSCMTLQMSWILKVRGEAERLVDGFRSFGQLID